MHKLLNTLILSLFATLLMAQDSTSLSLTNAIELALEKNYGIQIQQKNTEILQESNYWGATGFLPSVSLSGSDIELWNFGDLEYQRSTLSGSVDLDWTFFRGFAARITKDKLNQMETQGKENLSLVIENTIVGVIQAYYQVLLHQENVALTQEVMLLSEDRYTVEQHKKDLGASVTYDLLQAQNAFLADKSTYLSAQSSLNNAKRQLNYLMAIDLETPFIFTSAFEADTTPFDKAILTDKLVSNNQTLKSQYINLELAKLNIESAKSSYYPTLYVGASGGYTDYNQDYTNASNTDVSYAGMNASVSAGISYTLFNGGQRKQQLQIAQLNQEVAQIETTEMVEELKNQLAQEFELYQVRKELLTLAEENLKAAKLNLDLSKEKFNSGAINSFNYRDVQKSYLSIAYNYQQAVYNTIESYNVLLRLTGGIIEQHQQTGN